MNHIPENSSNRVIKIIAIGLSKERIPCIIYFVLLLKDHYISKVDLFHL